MRKADKEQAIDELIEDLFFDSTKKRISPEEAVDISIQRIMKENNNKNDYVIKDNSK